MSSMVTFTFYNEIQIAECPSSLDELKQTIKKLYLLSDTQIDNCLISYIRNNKHYYIFTEEEFQKAKLIIESVFIKIELSDEEKYVNIDPLIDEEYEVFKLDKKEKKQSSFSYVEDECIKEEKNDNHQHKEQVDEDKKEVKDKDIKDEMNKIKCKKCKKNIKGIRYLCGVCENFNLCHKCEKKEGKKHGHPLLKIRNPKLAPIYFKCILK